MGFMAKVTPQLSTNGGVKEKVQEEQGEEEELKGEKLTHLFMESAL